MAAACGIADATKRLKVVALQPDLEARGVAGRLIDGVSTVDYAGFVDLVAEHPTNQSWL
jgi:tRNA 2-thiouridine synthesizing protein B